MLAYIRDQLGRPADAEPLYNQALEMNRRLYKDDHLEVAVRAVELRDERGRLGAAEESRCS